MGFKNVPTYCLTETWILLWASKWLRTIDFPLIYGGPMHIFQTFRAKLVLFFQVQSLTNNGQDSRVRTVSELLKTVKEILQGNPATRLTYCCFRTVHSLYPKQDYNLKSVTYGRCQQFPLPRSTWQTHPLDLYKVHSKVGDL